MISTSHQLPAAPKRLEKRLRKDQHAGDIKAIHESVDLLPADYLVCHQTDEHRAQKIRAKAKQRIAKRNAKRAAGPPFYKKPVIFTPMSGVVL